MKMTGMKGILAALVAVHSLAASAELTRAERLRRIWDSDDRTYVFVAVHRGDWIDHSENSLSGIRGIIEKGADIMELDAQRTADGHFVISHDGSVDRCTDGKGSIGKMKLEDLVKLRLREHGGGKNAALTDETMPTLEQALEACRGKVLVNIDRSQNWPEEIYDVVRRLGMERQVILKSALPFEKTRQKFGRAWADCASGKVEFMPILWCYDKTNSVNVATCDPWLAMPRPPHCYEVCFGSDETAELVLGRLKAHPSNPRLWVNVMWGSLCAGHHDGWAKEGWKGYDPERGWGWVVDRGATVLQTDHTAGLVRYLTARGRHTLK